MWVAQAPQDLHVVLAVVDVHDEVRERRGGVGRRGPVVELRHLGVEKGLAGARLSVPRGMPTANARGPV